MQIKLIKKYLDTLYFQKNYSQNTIIKYQKILIEFNEFLVTNNFDIKVITHNEIEIFIKKLYYRKLTNSTICLYISCLKSFFSFLEINEYIKNNPLELIEYPKREKTIPKFLFDDEIIEFLKAIKKEKNILSKRDFIIFLLLFATGIRASELLELKITDIYEEKIIVLGKGNVPREIPLSNYVKEELDYFIKNIWIQFNSQTNYLILNKFGNKLSYNGLYYIFKKKLNDEITPHTLRHSFATNLLNNGMNIREIQFLLGHKNLNTTEIYTKVSKRKIKNAYLDAVVRQEDL